MVKIISPLSTTYLTFDKENDNRLSFIKTDYPNYEGFHISQLNKLNYGDYLNSKGETETVVTTVNQQTEVIEKLMNNTTVLREDVGNPEYDKMIKELEDLEDQNNS